MLVPLLGGLGMFLLGMVLLTDGLKALAGQALRGILMRFVRGPLSGVGWGALVTALVQSSTATTLATVGFVSAGLLTFTQAVGVIFGANLGTTSTGWIVSQLGFKVSLGSISPPLVLIGAALRLLSKGRAAHAGTACAGFGLLFIGIDFLQDGMTEVAARLSSADLPGAGQSDSLLSRAALVGFGFVITVIMQSSSAAMATTLAAVASGAIGLEQAAALVIGQNIGTTPTAVAAAIGAPAAAKRTAVAHVLFNGLTAGVAFGLLPPMLRGIQVAADFIGADDPPTVLATFHTAFNGLGVALLLPVAGPFARAIEWLLPDRSPPPTRFLAPAVAEVGPIALEAARRAVAQVLGHMGRIVSLLPDRSQLDATDAQALVQSTAALGDIRQFLHGLGRASQEPVDLHRHAALMHSIDHAARLGAALREYDAGRATARSPSDPVVRRAVDTLTRLGESLAATCQRLAAGNGRPASDPTGPPPFAANAAHISREIAELRRVERSTALTEAAAGRLDPDAAVARIDALLRVDRIAYHAWRAVHYLEQPVEESAPPPGDNALDHG